MFEKQIAKGMTWLDRHAPGWEQEINLWQLNLNACTDCVLGQLAGNFNWVVPEWQPTLDDRPACLLPAITELESYAMGFAQPDSSREMTRKEFEEYQGRWDILTEEWRAAIRDRRKPPKGGRITVLRLPRFAYDPIRAEVLR